MPEYLTKEQEQRIGDIFTARAAMTSIAARTKRVKKQAPAQKWQIFELQRMSSSQYYFLPRAPGLPVPRADGYFLFVILASKPGRVYCGARLGAVGVDPTMGIVGHTSLSLRADVLYAGEILLHHGELDIWTNGSGHYLPDEAWRHKNLIPSVQRVLPEGKFVNSKTGPSAALRRLDEAAGELPSS